MAAYESTGVTALWQPIIKYFIFLKLGLWI